ncbi:hypothetical protein SAMN05421510_10225 [Nitrosomonas ureae]|uniref:Uncharacterized protein n=2 Tax=Nitrosomonas ureae TaxID=44577 RepID=A0A1H9DFF8_9PROT|nr:hypothetical protein C8R28_104122 [Nitrosomonas ureae]PXX14705.1 hypothetical protein C8R27_11460 [Nitrosomonas ureae]SDU25853.1 hypothetical protein SAMN05216406_1405 [Nitrosomonas ureae]SEQ12204.1 hypothetical protein SAMN05421510_10225 [Nitrosomonas ureae]SOD20810.1 hypothetical protein SAMN06297164_2869 [Nitrosomonas ureae]
MGWQWAKVILWVIFSCCCDELSLLINKMPIISITAEHAAELILALLKANSWLNTPGVMTQDDFHAKGEAILFLQQMAIHGASNFGDTN